METTQQHIDQLIATIWHATENRSVTNVMVARVLDWLNRRHSDLLLQMQTCCAEKREELRILDSRITSLAEELKGVRTVADSAYARSSENAGRIGILGGWVNAILQYLKTGDWDSGGKAVYTMEFDTGGDNYISFGETKHISCRVLYGWEDVTDLVSSWIITRHSGDDVDDAAWALKQKAKDFAGEIDIALTAGENDIGSRGRATFRVVADIAAETRVRASLIF